MTDVESVQPQPSRANRSNNPYADNGDGTLIRSRWHPMNVLQRGIWMSGSIYLLHRMNTYHNIMTSPDISHQWFKVGLAAAIGELSVVTYVYISSFYSDINIFRFLLSIVCSIDWPTASYSHVIDFSFFRSFFYSFILAEGVRRIV